MAIYDIRDDTGFSETEDYIEINEEQQATPPRLNGAVWWFRLFAFAALCLMLMWLALSLVGLAVRVLVGALALYRTKESRDLVRSGWRRVCNAIATALAAFIAIFSPALGLKFGGLFVRHRIDKYYAWMHRVNR